MTTNTDGAMPELPEPDGYAAISGGGTIIVPPRDFAKHNGYAIFTADQMREYARAAIQQAAGCEHLRGDVGSRWCALAEKPEYPEQFPRRILDLIKEVARREDSGSYGAWQDENGEPMQDDADAALKWISGQQAAGSVPEGCRIVPMEPSKAMLDRAVAFALNVSLGGSYGWTDYMRDLYARMLSAVPSKAGSSDHSVPCAGGGV